MKSERTARGGRAATRRLVKRTAFPAVAILALGGASQALADFTVGDRVWYDVNNNGILDPNEPGIPGVLVASELDNNADCIPDNNPSYPRRYEVTNAFGSYLFRPPLGGGRFIIELDPYNFTSGPLVGFTSSTGSALTTGPYEPGLPEGDGPSPARDGRDHGTVVGDRIRACPITLNGNEPVGEAPTPGIPPLPTPDKDVQSTIDFGVFRPFAPPPGAGGIGPVGPGGGATATWKIGNRVWNDADRDGIQDRRERGIRGVLVRLYDRNGKLMGTTTTNARGFYQLNGLVPGRYRLGFARLPRASRPSPLRRGPSRARDSNVSFRTKRTEFISIKPGQIRNDIDAGFIVPAGIGGFVWRDTDRDGQMEKGEPRLRRVLVILSTWSGRRVAVRRTSNGGRYLFLNIPPGNYRIQVVPPRNLRFTRQNRGNDATDSDIRVRFGTTGRLRIIRGIQNLTVGAGLR